MSFKYVNLIPCTERKKQTEKYRIDDDVKIIVESNAIGPSERTAIVYLRVSDDGGCRFRRRRKNEIIFDKDSYDFIKQNLCEVRNRLDHIRLDSLEAKNDWKNFFKYNDISISVGRNQEGIIIIDFSQFRKRQHVTLNEGQFAALYNMINRSLIDGAIDRLSQCADKIE